MLFPDLTSKPRIFLRQHAPPPTPHPGEFDFVDVLFGVLRAFGQPCAVDVFDESVEFGVEGVMAYQFQESLLRLRCLELVGACVVFEGVTVALA